MTGEQLTITLVLAGTLALFLWGRWRHDMVALAALLVTVATGLMPAERAFDGFAQPAVITVACVLVLSNGLERTGAVDRLARLVLPEAAGPLPSLAALLAVAAALSAVMNNVGALALLMPLGVQLAHRHAIPVGRVLMPLSFASILGGTTTLIGTPPNLVVAGFRAQASGQGFAMFDFARVGLPVVVAGLVFLLLARGLVPVRRPAGQAAFELTAYLTEAKVVPDSRACGRRIAELEALLGERDAQIVGLVRGGERIVAPAPWRRVVAGDILVIEAEPEGLAEALEALGLTLEEAVPLARAGESANQRGDGEAESGPAAAEPAAAEVELAELAVLPGSTLVGRTATGVRLRSRYAVNLLAIAREGRHSIRRLRTTPIRAGDVLLVQGTPDAIGVFARDTGLVPLAPRPLRLPDPRRALLAAAITAGAVLLSALDLAPPALAFTGGLLAAMASGVVPPRRAYQAIDWPVIVLLGAMMPVARAMATTGTADLVARVLLEQLAGGDARLVLLVLLVVTMTLSDVMNNAATAAVMAPVALGIADRLAVGPDPFLMAVAIGASCAFLTPIGHQNNTLILGPGGFRFTDYWRLGLPLEVLVVVVAVPALLLAWPLRA